MDIKDIAKSLKELELPKNYKDLHNVRELLTIANCCDTISNYLCEYKENFIDSFIMNKDQVLEYIPQKDYSKYTLMPGYTSLFNNKVKVLNINKKIIKNIVSKLSKHKHLSFYNIKQNFKDLTQDIINNDCSNIEIYKDDINVQLYLYPDLSKVNLHESLNFIEPEKSVFLVDTKNKNIHVRFTDQICSQIDKDVLQCFNRIQVYINSEFKYTKGINEIIETKLYYSLKRYAGRDYSLPAYQNDVYKTTFHSLTLKHIFSIDTNQYIETKIKNINNFDISGIRSVTAYGISKVKDFDNISTIL